MTDMIADTAVASSVASTLSGAVFSGGTMAYGTFAANYNAKNQFGSVTDVNVTLTGLYLPYDDTTNTTIFTGTTVTDDGGTSPDSTSGAYAITLSNPIDSTAPASNQYSYGGTGAVQVLAWLGVNATMLDSMSSVDTGPSVDTGAGPSVKALTDGGAIADCFMAGTQILTPAGEVSVKTLKFDSWAEHEALYGDQETVPEMDYPRIRSARQLSASLLARLAARGEALFSTGRVILPA
jgi:hypothetical protein